MDVRSMLQGLLERRLSERGRRWLEGEMRGGELLLSFPQVSRKVGSAPLELDEKEGEESMRLGIGWPVARSVDELARVLLLLERAGSPTSERAGSPTSERAGSPTSERAGPPTSAPSAEASLAQGAFLQGDNKERCAVLRALPLMPTPKAHVPLAAEAMRTHVTDVFEALACENPFAASHLAEAQFNQLVMKAVFLGIPVARILGLGGRKNPELARMAGDHAREREAAGRSVPTCLGHLCDMPLAKGVDE
ncbi:MAG: EboA domain-containing protein [Deltaproteobacteria bacterium]|nr:EboA domain-containing protein [Deltaproteobacteria bacterium]